MKSRTTRTMRYFNALKTKFDNVDDFAIDELKEDIESQKVRHFGFTNFCQNGKFYTCDLLDKKFKKDENYLIFQEEYMYDSFCGYLAYPLKNGKYWVVSFKD
ncbi:hypothetical protein [Campylobacter mucosalis]|uniref:Uncharacterized protein n=1 Tax=Campylobacter mucosalis CCUG 21559 TaxID=1032067 RepID=A0A6G5QGE3_9BACT|nr:hypothetical protein [Campylobacter mucosalis]QCD44086.1 hypothetical protein CMUC_0272 [Campylobacter mucosalis CCUG 21559]QCD44424.1 hypothetical protein CMUC_0625 [Campylobacter mucosalis CCUG 21559]QCD44679.1 hypothetical protein CMUC_0890 [Campylobacter mucosalis CCUG 21559]